MHAYVLLMISRACIPLLSALQDPKSAEGRAVHPSAGSPQATAAHALTTVPSGEQQRALPSSTQTQPPPEGCVPIVRRQSSDGGLLSSSEQLLYPEVGSASELKQPGAFRRTPAPSSLLPANVEYAAKPLDVAELSKSGSPVRGAGSPSSRR